MYKPNKKYPQDSIIVMSWKEHTQYNSLLLLLT